MTRHNLQVYPHNPQVGKYSILFYGGIKILQVSRKPVLEPRNKTRFSESLPPVQITQKIYINQSTTVAAITRKSEKTQHQIKNTILQCRVKIKIFSVFHDVHLYRTKTLAVHFYMFTLHNFDRPLKFWWNTELLCSTHIFYSAFFQMIVYWMLFEFYMKKNLLILTDMVWEFGVLFWMEGHQTFSTLNNPLPLNSLHLHYCGFWINFNKSSYIWPREGNWKWH